MSEDNDVQMNWIPDLDPLSDDVFDYDINITVNNRSDNQSPPSGTHAVDTTKSTNHSPSDDNKNQCETEKAEKRKTVSFDDGNKQNSKRSRSSSRERETAAEARNSRPKDRETRKSSQRSHSRDYGSRQRRQRSKDHYRSPYSHNQRRESNSSAIAGPSNAHNQSGKPKIDWETIAIEKINFAEEQHYAIVDFYVEYEIFTKAMNKNGQIHFMDYPNASINELANAVTDKIHEAKQSPKRTSITASIFGRHFERLGRNGVIAMTKKIAEEIPMDRRGYSKIKLTFSTITYFPALQHRWQEIQETNYFLKQVSHSLGSAPHNLHKWTLSNNKFHTKRKEIMGHCFEDYVRKTGLGRHLSKIGTEKITKGIIMHHTSGVREVTGQTDNIEPHPVHLNITTGYKLPDVDCKDKDKVQEKRWLFKYMGEIEGKTQLAINTHKQSEEDFKLLVKEAIDDIRANHLKNQATPVVDEDVIMTTNEDQDNDANIANLKQTIIEQKCMIQELETKASSFNTYRHELDSILKDETYRANNLQQQVNSLKRQLEKANNQEQLERKDPATDRAEKKITRLESKITKLVKDLREEQDENTKEMQEAKEELKDLKDTIQDLKDTIQDLKHDLQVEKEINKALKEKGREK